ncbi:gamma-glutamylcyclotransferase family protein [Labrenzia sp. 011]|uniref:gamma-glutamylcyclotransferase family protein n=1 Tax=Labrenzia sp. 011 TaxID=2171494 RepID=UPI000D523E4D|nr:gamma-glutamylcyclotransferase family protein [Labrenzia sp. 011]PVB63341.1 gamma-glutamylcyclotransferase [Labrenzia sp. 011]
MTITYFGYGSLVNIDTIPAATQVVPGVLHGWRREWKVCGEGEDGLGRCALSVREDEGSEIRGVMAREPRAGLKKLELREQRYHKVEGIGAAFRCDAAHQPGAGDMFLFRASPDHHRWGTDSHPILQSYLDCVLAGYYRIWGEEGIDHFIRTTDGWHVPVLQDRDSPRYPRKIVPDPDLACLIDRKLAALAVRYLTAEDQRRETVSEMRS